nr:hypothetical protein [uncultured Enterobacter sp.]
MKRLLLAVVGIIVALVAAIAGWKMLRTDREWTCSSFITLNEEDGDNKISLSLFQRLTVYPNETASVNVAGILASGADTYSLSRVVNYRFTRTGSTQYTVVATNVSKTSKDTLPHALERKYVPSLISGTQRVIGLRPLGNGNLVVSYSAGPYFICARH